VFSLLPSPGTCQVSRPGTDLVHGRVRIGPRRRTQRAWPPLLARPSIEWRGPDLNLRPSGYECPDARAHVSALISVLPDERAKLGPPSSAVVGVGRRPLALVVLYDCCTGELPSAAPRSSALVGASRADTLLTAAVQAASSRPRWIGTRRSSSSNTATSSKRAPSASRYWRRVDTRTSSECSSLEIAP
jgi:hypothetical protein